MELTVDEKLAILRAADELIAQGGRNLLAKILKGSREKKILALGLDKCPVYGYFKSEKIADIVDKVDWMIDYDFLDIQYFGKLPKIVFTERGWKIESDQLSDEFLAEWDTWIEEDRPLPNMEYLKDRNRNLILLFLEKVKETGDRKYIPYLKAWEKIEYKKVRAKIRSSIEAIESNQEIDHMAIQNREAEIQEALLGSAPQDMLLKCWECGNRFTFTVGEQQFYKQKGFDFPKRCKECRDRRKYEEFYEEFY
ncbi:RQC-minor-1 family DNA-binding protein [Oceanobacillus damuensis]|uniref:RQC-minor-1 family DNA-binding protein n=1 Tax=Oceanobacillus damuensis TaxID=937928 RepID=UPI0008378C75|nr:RQC-minor-1 family DNA-binding protein [Oceanobacillus damuensis]